MPIPYVKLSKLLSGPRLLTTWQVCKCKRQARIMRKQGARKMHLSNTAPTAPVQHLPWLIISQKGWQRVQIRTGSVPNFPRGSESWKNCSSYKLHHILSSFECSRFLKLKGFGRFRIHHFLRIYISRCIFVYMCGYLHQYNILIYMTLCTMCITVDLYSQLYRILCVYRYRITYYRYTRYTFTELDFLEFIYHNLIQEAEIALPQSRSCLTMHGL